VAQVVAAIVLFSLADVTGYVAARGHYTPFSGAKAISSTVWDETVNYAPSASRFMRTGAVYSGDVKGAGSFDSVQPLVPTVVIGGLGWMSGSLEWTWIILHGLLPALTWLLVFRLARSYTRSTMLASAVGWAAALVPFGLQQIFLFGLNPFQQPLEVVRMPDPAFSYPLFLLAAVALAGALRRDDRRRFALAALLCGGLAYVYFYYWISALAGLGLLLAAALLFRERRLARRVLTIAVGSLVVAAPYLFLSLTTDQGAVLDRNGSAGSHYSRPKDVALMLLLGLIFLAYARFRLANMQRSTTLVLLAFLTGAGIGLNMQLFTGIDAIEGHFMLRVIKPVGFLLLALLFVAGVDRGPRLRPWAYAGAAAVIVSLFTLGVVRQYEVGVRTLSAHRTTTSRVATLLWLRDHVPTSAVVGTTDRELSADIPAMTGNFLFVPDGGKARVSSSEIVFRYLIVARLQGQSLGQVVNDLRDRPVDGQHQFDNISYLLRVDSLPAEARRLWPTVDLRSDLRRRDLDYLLTTVPGVPAPVRALYPGARLAHADGQWSLIRLGKPASA
jgi:hypothetical protein